ncbi:DUF4249 family protein [Membranihabitans marinus]|uniref:DUF4249 family protein n=1 Tax=Membranihabitans marinus TaxID=1227546 RepID=UPI001F17F959|nr:DUF4249 family protein [Membranihabitans marinus]
MNYIYTFFIAVVVVSCDGAFTKEIDLDISNFESKGVLVGLFANYEDVDTLFTNYWYWSPADSTERLKKNRVYITQSSPAGQPVYFDFYEADVNLITPTEIVALPFSASEGSFSDVKFHHSDEIFESGVEYEIKANYLPTSGSTGWSEISAKDVMPAQIDFEIEDLNIHFPDGNRFEFGGSMRLAIEDETDRDNYYQVDVVAIVTDLEGNTDIVSSYLEIKGVSSGFLEEDVDVSNFDDTHLSEDGKIRVDFDFNSVSSFYEEPGVEVHLFCRLSNLSQNYAKYKQSAEQFRNNDGNPFAEPVEIYSNVEDGYGIFAFTANSYREKIIVH